MRPHDDTANITFMVKTVAQQTHERTERNTETHAAHRPAADAVRLQPLLGALPLLCPVR